MLCLFKMIPFGYRIIFIMFFKKIFLSLSAALILFVTGYTTGIYCRYTMEKNIIPEHIAEEYSTNFDHSNIKNPFKEVFKRYLISTTKEYKKYKMRIFFNLETKPYMSWFIDRGSNGDKILDVGGATGFQWKVFENKVKNKNLDIKVIEIDTNSIKIGKERYISNYLQFYHVDEIDKIQNNIDTILMCEVYIQIKNAPKILKGYIEKFPNSKAVIIHSVFKDSFLIKVLSYIKQYVLKYIPILETIHGRAMTDKIFYKEMKSVNLKVVEEHDITNLSKHHRPFQGRVKAYVVKSI